MKQFLKDFLAYTLYPKGYFIGFALAISPYVWDILTKGAREFNLVSVGNVGAIIQIVGFVLMVGAYFSEKYLDNETKGG